MVERIRELKIPISEKSCNPPRIKISRNEIPVPPSCALNQGDIVTILTNLEIIFSLNSPACLGCQSNYKCKIHNPNLELPTK